MKMGLLAEVNLKPWLVLVCLLFQTACVSFQANPDVKTYLSRSQTKTQDNVTVTVAVLNHEESRALFGVDLSLRFIQAIWVEIINNDDHPYWMVNSAIDPDYFSPHEVAYSHRVWLNAGYNKKLESHFSKISFHNPIPPNSTHSGFIFVNLDEDEKEVDIDLISKLETKFFDFYFELSELRAASLREVEQEHARSAIKDLTESELRQALRALPCCTTGEDGTKHADPLNLVIIGDSDMLFPAFVRRGWHHTEQSYLGSIWRTINSFLFGRHYRYSPVSPLYFQGRKQDIALQKARGTVHQRNHLRLWLTDYTFEGKEVWVGQISRDIGVRFTLHSPTFTTHKIDADIDEARTALAEDMLFSQGVMRIGFVEGVGAKHENEPGYNLTGDPYYTDGLRIVMEFDKRPNNIEDIDFFDWATPPRNEVLIE